MFRSVDGYCERLGPGFWAEPLNAVTNAAFLIAALIVWRLAVARGRGDDWAVRALCLVVTAIGIGSFLFHTFANPLTGALDVAPIGVFILLYLYLSLPRFFEQPRWAGAAAVAAFLPAVAGVTWVIRETLGPLNGSALYAAVLALILVTAGALAATGRGAVARGWAVGAAIFAVSLTLRTLDDQTGPVCQMVPWGTHWGWHVFNGMLLGWMTWLIILYGERKDAAA